ncbi:hypothetical protein OHA21_27480 [Actinoplanes sp. NBC_00393]|uniref:hypothetical protein n=1 Tax=Actinoplanes sp. NBC_00393 TaxID=2975953 RepID=UPI002E2197E3
MGQDVSPLAANPASFRHEVRAALGVLIEWVRGSVEVSNDESYAAMLPGGQTERVPGRGSRAAELQFSLVADGEVTFAG